MSTSPERTCGGAGRPIPGGAFLAACLCALGALAGVQGCDSITGLGVDLELYDPLPPVTQVDFTTVHPDGDWLYWELRHGWGPMDQDSIMGSGGTVPRDELPAAVQMELDQLDLPTGFAGGCLPAWCFKYIAAVDPDGAVVTFATTTAFIEFLGPRESSAEAILLLDAAGYHWEPPEPDGSPRPERATGIRPFGDGWEAVVLELTRDCAPVQTDRVVVRVGRLGELSVMGREIFERLEGACI